MHDNICRTELRSHLFTLDSEASENKDLNRKFYFQPHLKCMLENHEEIIPVAVQKII
jgi:hypothetical protein